MKDNIRNYNDSGSKGGCSTSLPRKVKVYAARGLLDWRMALNVGGAILRINFTGGSMGSNGVIPAKYATDNAALQQIIERTPQFKSGKIYLYAVRN